MHVHQSLDGSDDDDDDDEEHDDDDRWTMWPRRLRVSDAERRR